MKSVSYLQAVDAALCFGWIDGQKKSDDERYWLQRFTPRSEKSIWSKINREKGRVRRVSTKFGMSEFDPAWPPQHRGERELLPL